MNYSFDFKGKTVLITGAASGIGLESTVAFLQNGAKVCMADRNGELVSKKADELRKTYGNDKAAAFTCDITDPESVKAMAESIKNSGVIGKIDHAACCILRKITSWPSF